MPTTQVIDFKRFPTTRYQGSKRKILPWIHSNLKDIRFTTALDAFGGSGSVSYLLKKMGKAVTYNDNLHFNYIIGKAIIENDVVSLTEEDLAALLKRQKDLHYTKFIQKTFKDVYFLDHENKWLDTVVPNILNMNHYGQETLPYKQALAYYSVFQASLSKRPFNLFHRKNLYLRLAEVERNFGNKTTWEKPFQDHFLAFATEANNLVFKGVRKCHSNHQSAFEIDPYGYDLVYLDPPYIRSEGSNESSKYGRCYHFLEGLSRYTDWPNLIDYQTPTRRLDANTDGFSEHANIYEEFEKLLCLFQKSTIVISYKKGGIPSIPFLVNLLRKFKKKVRTVSEHYKYALNHQNGDAKNNREVLIIGE